MNKDRRMEFENATPSITFRISEVFKEPHALRGKITRQDHADSLEQRPDASS